jgi:hypothetical protein
MYILRAFGLPWNSCVKDALERKLHKLVCAGQLDLKTAQREIASNWIEAYKKYVAKRPPAPIAKTAPKNARANEVWVNTRSGKYWKAGSRFYGKTKQGEFMSVVLFYLTDEPADAAWLRDDERRWLMDRLAAEERRRVSARHYSVLQALLNPRVLALSLVYFGAVATNYGLSFFLPQIVKAFGMTNLQTGFVSTIPYVVGVVSIVWWSHRSDAKLERRFHTAFAIFVAAGGLIVAAFLDDPRAKMLAFSVAGFGIFGALPVFWTLPTAFLSGAAAAGGIAIINSIGNLAGFVGPSVMGLIKDSTGSFTNGLLVLAGAAILAMAIVLALGHDTALERTPGRDSSAAE